MEGRRRRREEEVGGGGRQHKSIILVTHHFSERTPETNRPYGNPSVRIGYYWMLYVKREDVTPASHNRRWLFQTVQLFCSKLIVWLSRCFRSPIAAWQVQMKPPVQDGSMQHPRCFCKCLYSGRTLRPVVPIIHSLCDKTNKQAASQPAWRITSRL